MLCHCEQPEGAKQSDPKGHCDPELVEGEAISKSGLTTGLLRRYAPRNDHGIASGSALAMTFGIASSAFGLLAMMFRISF